MNESKASGIFNEVKGKIKQAVGETFDNQGLANEGAADEVKGHTQQTWGSVKDTAHDLTTSHDAPFDTHEPLPGSERTPHEGTGVAHDLRTGISHAAENVKEPIQHGLDRLDRK